MRLCCSRGIICQVAAVAEATVEAEVVVVVVDLEQGDHLCVAVEGVLVDQDEITWMDRDGREQRVSNRHSWSLKRYRKVLSVSNHSNQRFRKLFDG
jgi:hypothetical protein